MRGSAQRVPGRPVSAALRAAWKGLSSPVHPGQEAALPLHAPPAQGSFMPCTQANGYALSEPAQGGQHPFTPQQSLSRTVRKPGSHPA
jgi:hypothetical protein